MSANVATALIDVDQSTACFVNLPGYKGGYTKLYGVAEAELWPA